MVPEPAKRESGGAAVSKGNELTIATAMRMAEAVELRAKLAACRKLLEELYSELLDLDPSGDTTRRCMELWRRLVDEVQP